MAERSRRLRAVLILTGAAVVAAAAPLSAQAVVAQKWAVATGHPEATAAGLGVLREGGNVMDAAVAASLTLGVAEPYGSGLGGKLVLLYRDGATGAVSCVVALCPAPQGVDREAFAELTARERKYGYHSVGVPGLPAGLHAAHAAWGSRPWAELVAPAERLAREGIVVSETMRGLWAPHVDDLAADPEASRLFLVDGRLPAVGDRLPNADLADTLARMAETGVDDFYRGETARRIAVAALAAGATLSMRDFAGYEPARPAPLAVNYRGYRIYSSPPPLTGGATVLATLRAAELMGGPQPTRRDATHIDRLARVLRMVYPRVTREVADTPEAAQLAAELLSDESLRSLAEEAAALDPAAIEAAPVAEGEGDDSLSAGTTHLVIANAEGDMVSLTQSLSLHFGAAVVAPGTGVLLNDSMSNFATNWRGSPNAIAPGKRARSTVAPVIATRDGLPTLAMGLPGGQRIPTMTLQVLADHLGAGAPLDDALGRPRWHLRRPLNRRQPKNLVDLEEPADGGGLGPLRAALEDLGWQTQTKPANGLYFGGGNAIGYATGGRLIAVADPRRTNNAAGD